MCTNHKSDSNKSKYLPLIVATLIAGIFLSSNSITRGPVALASTKKSASELVPFDSSVQTQRTVKPSNKKSDNSELVPFQPKDEDCSYFKDMQEENRFCYAIIWAKNEGIVRGYSDGTFRPDAAVSRAEALKMIFHGTDLFINEKRYIEYLGFSDLDRLSWYMPYVESALNLKIATGYSDKRFRPNRSVTRAEALKILLETAKHQDDFVVKTKTYGLPYRDVPATDANRWSISYLWTAQEYSLNYDSYYFNPDRYMTRAELVDMLFRYNSIRALD